MSDVYLKKKLYDLLNISDKICIKTNNIASFISNKLIGAG